MSKRLASFAGPSAPSSSPIPAQSTEPANNKSDSGPKKKNKGRDVTPSSPSPFSPSREPKSPSAQRRPKLEAFSPSRNSRVSAHAPSTLKSKSLAFLESPIQISTRIALKRTAADLEEWKTVVSRYAFKCARALVDATTELENALGVLPDASQPRSRMLGPRLRDLNSKREELRGYMVELDICFIRIAERVASLERGLVKLIQHDGIESTEGDPVWKSTSWPFIHHVSHVAQLLRFLNRANHSLNTFAALIISYSFSSTRSLENYNGVVTTFETSQSLSTSHTDRSSPTFPQARTALASWSGEASRSTEFVQEWCGICAVEVPAWEEIEVGREESEEEDALKDI